ncbi:endoplasmic reticulum-based factor for assembly of V-ATPase-domain-containing protein [Mucor mucedo]|uniref:endoplasmic reticulum-based factor for assembly of V-ATPase-domain-containing protein n=1 Tax=Mucor mucedo TaxID=29922 RepID=UPI00221EE846|nr:endoplasmic reticulum-based factor for assembly of V-ATPase-domain-containing protein [Mucor mucedo]KAI7893073.1 endoplasmic reticulum-based factor for assembly of V-ATPase-domain-containing protein [Mucor mucedo]
MKLTLTKDMQASVELALKGASFSEKYKEEAEMIASACHEKESVPITVELVQYVSKQLNQSFHELLKGTTIYIEPKEIKPKNPEFEAYMAKLRAEQQERDYKRMVSSVITSEDQKFNLGIKPDELKEAKSHIATIFNILFSMIAVYTAVFKASKTIMDDLGLQVLMGLAGAIMIGTVEGILYAKYAYVATLEKKSKSKRIATL